MTHKSGEKAPSQSFVSTLFMTVCFMSFKLDTCSEECDCSCRFLSDDTEALVLCERACEVRVTVEDEGFSIAGVTASDALFWSGGTIGIFPVSVDKSMPGSEDNLKR